MELNVLEAGSLEDLLPDPEDHPVWADEDEYEFSER